MRAAYGSDRAYKPYPPTAKQLAARKLFTKRVKSGAFKRKRKK